MTEWLIGLVVVRADIRLLMVSVSTGLFLTFKLPLTLQVPLIVHLRIDALHNKMNGICRCRFPRP